MKKILGIVIILGIAVGISLLAYREHMVKRFDRDFSTAEELITTFEGFKGRVYICPSGRKTIGYGFTDRKLVEKGRMTKAEAKEIVRKYCAALRIRIAADLHPVHLADHELEALVSFVYNVGWDNWKASTMREKLLTGKSRESVAAEFPRWKYSRKTILLGLIRRRAAEKRLFLGV